MITLNNISLTFQGNDRPTLKPLSLYVQKHEFIILLGHNGCGKSTLFQLINNQIKPSTGAVSLEGQSTLITQNVHQGTISDLSVLENMILMTHHNHKLLPYRRLKDMLVEKIAEIGLHLERYIDTPLRYLSGGQRQVIATICALNSSSPIILLDEHTSALDPHTQKILMDYTVKMIRKNNLTALMITHNLQDAKRYGDRLIIMKDGEIMLDHNKSTADDISDSELLSFFHSKDNLGEYHDI